MPLPTSTVITPQDIATCIRKVTARCQAQEAAGRQLDALANLQLLQGIAQTLQQSNATFAARHSNLPADQIPTVEYIRWHELQPAERQTIAWAQGLGENGF